MTRRCVPCIYPQNLNPDGSGMREKDSGALAYYTKNHSKLVKIPLNQETKHGNCKHTSALSHSPVKMDSENKRKSFQRHKFKSVVQKESLMGSLRKSGAEPEAQLRSDPDISKFDDYRKLETDGFSLKAIQVDGPLGKLLEDYNLKELKK